MTRTLAGNPALALTALLLPALAQAHPGHASDASFAAGALHPLLGADHLALLAVAGVLASRLGTKAAYALGAIFLGLIGACAAGEAGAWTYAAGFLLTSTAAIFLTGAATAIATRRFAPRLTAASRRSPTSAAVSAPAHCPSGAR